MKNLNELLLILAANKQDIYDDPHCNTTSCSFPSGELRGLEPEISTMSGTGMSSTRSTTGASELLALLRVLGEGLRLSCLYKCQVLDQCPEKIKTVCNFTIHK